MTESNKKLNCWDIKKCERNRGGKKENELGVCPAAKEEKLNGIHGCKNGGRACWIIKGTFCDSEIQCDYKDKLNK